MYENYEGEPWVWWQVHEDTESLELNDHIYNWELEKAMEAGEDEDALPEENE